MPFSAIQVALAGNLLLAVAKTGVGLMAGSQALFADGLHSFTDVVNSVIGAVGARFGGDPPDRDHPFGHGAHENLAALVVGLVMAWAAWILLRAAGRSLMGAALVAPEAMAAPIAIGSCLAKEAMFRHADREWKRTRSPAVQALARDHRSDALSSIAALAGILGAQAGMPMLDPLAAVVIAGMILQLAWDTVTQNLDVLLDREPEIGDLKAGLAERAKNYREPLEVEVVRAHLAGSALNLEIDVRLAGGTSLEQAHRVAHEVEAWARELEPRVVTAQVHLEPLGEPSNPA